MTAQDSFPYEQQLTYCPGQKLLPELFHHGGGDGGDALPDGRAPRERDHPDVAVLDDGLPGARPQAAHQVHDAGWEP